MGCGIPSYVRPLAVMLDTSLWELEIGCSGLSHFELRTQEGLARAECLSLC